MITFPFSSTNGASVFVSLPFCPLFVVSPGFSVEGSSGFVGCSGFSGCVGSSASTTLTETVSTVNSSLLSVTNPLALNTAASVFSFATNVYVTDVVEFVALAADNLTSPATVSFTVKSPILEVTEPFTYSKLFAS